VGFALVARRGRVSLLHADCAEGSGRYLWGMAHTILGWKSPYTIRHIQAAILFLLHESTRFRRRFNYVSGCELGTVHGSLKGCTLAWVLRS
jgi:hypothetical protein